MNLGAHQFRFWGCPCAGTTDLWSVAPEEVHHIRKVLRLKVGEPVELCDGRGTLIVGHIAQLHTDKVLVAVDQVMQQPQPQPVAELCLLIGALKPSVFDEVLPMLVELGVTRLCIFQQKGRNLSYTKEKVIQRWQRIVAASVKQCKRLYVPQIQVKDSLEAAVEYAAQHLVGSIAWLHCCPGYKNDLSLLRLSEEHQPHHKVIVVGSESGFSSEESQYLTREKFRPFTLGPHILRAKTAAVAALALAHSL
ncbi:MAG: RsmE family RNA methyltransferase [Zetaproteobacteria bacterium]|nr:RsmE family RNA methyltransferase [Zetaproteobacteria bacterium]